METDIGALVKDLYRKSAKLNLAVSFKEDIERVRYDIEEIEEVILDIKHSIELLGKG